MQAILVVQPGRDPLRHVAGMSLLKRNVLTVEHAGAERVSVVVDSLELIEEITGQFPDLIVTDSASLALGDDPTCLVASATRVHDKGLKDVVVGLEPRPDQAFAVDGPAGDAGSPVVVHRTAIQTNLAELGLSGLRRVTEESGQLEHLQTEPGFIDVEVVDGDSAAEATEALWQSCRKPLDGVTSTYLNRYISLFISRRIVDTRIHPNHISIFCIMLGIASGIAVLGASYWWVLLGAFFLKANSIIDGVDGELARVRWQFSRTGELLDSAGDNISNFSFYGALTWLMFHTGDVFYGWMGVAMLSMWSVHLAFTYGRLAGLRRGDVMIVRTNVDKVSGTFVSRVVDFFRYKVLRRDSFVMLTFVFIALEQYHATMIMMTCGAATVFGNVFVHYLISVKRWITGGARNQLTDEPVKES